MIWLSLLTFVMSSLHTWAFKKIIRFNLRVSRNARCLDGITKKPLRKFGFQA